MGLKTFCASTPTQALKAIKEKLGPEAVIVSSREVCLSGDKRYFEITVDDGPKAYKNIVRSERLQNGTSLPAMEEISIFLEKEQELDGRLCAKVFKNLSPSFEKRPLRIPEIKSQISKEISSIIKTAPSDTAKESTPRVIALVGPTGAGKTTTIAKLAAQFSLKSGLDIALATIDTYRVAAVDQLRAYADMLGVPLKVIFTPKDLRDTLGQMAHKDIIFVDTTGINYLSRPKITKLGGFFRDISNLETHLVINAGTRLKDMQVILDNYRVMAINRLLFTKIDESSTFGPMISLLHESSLPVSYITNGQEVPDDIEAANAGDIGDWLIQRYGGVQ